MRIVRIPSPKTEVYVIILISKINYQANISKQTFILKISAHFFLTDAFYFIFLVVQHFAA